MSSRVDKLAQDALEAARVRLTNRTSTSKSTAALVKLHSRLTSGKILEPNFAKDSRGVLVQKSELNIADDIFGTASSDMLSSTASAVLSAQKKKPSAKGWFGIEPLPLTEELKKDIKMITMRNYLDPKRFYKKADKIKVVLGVGTVVEGSAEYKSARLTNKERKSTFLDEVMADKQLRDYSKQKYNDIQREKAGTHRRSHQRKVDRKKTAGKRKQLRTYF